MGPINYRVGIPQAHNQQVGMPTYYESNHPRDGILMAHNHWVGMPRSVGSRTKQISLNHQSNMCTYIK